MLSLTKLLCLLKVTPWGSQFVGTLSLLHRTKDTFWSHRHVRAKDSNPDEPGPCRPPMYLNPSCFLFPRLNRFCAWEFTGHFGELFRAESRNDSWLLTGFERPGLHVVPPAVRGRGVEVGGHWGWSQLVVWFFLGCSMVLFSFELRMGSCFHRLGFCDWSEIGPGLFESTRHPAKDSARVEEEEGEGDKEEQ